MLVLSRKKHESIVIGEDIEISIVEVRGGKVRLGIQAPLDVRIVRDEARDRPTRLTDDLACTCGN